MKNNLYVHTYVVYIKPYRDKMTIFSKITSTLKNKGVKEGFVTKPITKQMQQNRKSYLNLARRHYLRSDPIGNEILKSMDRGELTNEETLTDLYQQSQAILSQTTKVEIIKSIVKYALTQAKQSIQSMFSNNEKMKGFMFVLNNFKPENIRVEVKNDELMTIVQRLEYEEQQNTPGSIGNLYFKCAKNIILDLLNLNMENWKSLLDTMNLTPEDITEVHETTMDEQTTVNEQTNIDDEQTTLIDNTLVNYLSPDELYNLNSFNAPVNETPFVEIENDTPFEPLVETTQIENDTPLVAFVEAPFDETPLFNEENELPPLPTFEEDPPKLQTPEFVSDEDEDDEDFDHLFDNQSETKSQSSILNFMDKIFSVEEELPPKPKTIINQNKRTNRTLTFE